MGDGGERVCLEQNRRDAQHEAAGRVAAPDHLASPHGVEQGTQQQGTEKVADREGEEEERCLGSTEIVEVLQDQGVGEEDGVVQEALGDHQADAEDRPGRVELEEDVRQLLAVQALALLDPAGVGVVVVGQLVAVFLDLLLDGGDDHLRLLGAPVREQPAGAFGNEAAQVDDAEAQHRTDEEGDPPADVDRKAFGVEQERAGEGAEGGTRPVGAVDGQIDAATVLAGDQFVDGGVDRGVLATDAHARDEPTDQEDLHVRCEARRRGAGKVQRQREGEHLLAAEGVGQPAEDQCPHHLTQEVDGARETHLRGAHAEGLLEAAGRHDLNLQAVQDPCGAQPEDDHPVEPGPRHVVHTSRDQALDRPIVRRRGTGHWRPPRRL